MINATEWLIQRLKDGHCHLCDEVRESAKENGITKKELKAARKEIGVKTYHQFDEDGATPNWFWYLDR